MEADRELRDLTEETPSDEQAQLDEERDEQLAGEADAAGSPYGGYGDEDEPTNPPG